MSLLGILVNFLTSQFPLYPIIHAFPDSAIIKCYFIPVFIPRRVTQNVNLETFKTTLFINDMTFNFSYLHFHSFSLILIAFCTQHHLFLDWILETQNLCE